MRCVARPACVVLVALSTLRVAFGLPAQPPPPLAMVVVRDAQDQLVHLRATLERHGFAGSPLDQALKRNPEFMQAQMGLIGIAGMAGMDPWTGVGTLLGDEVVVLVAPGEAEEPRLVGVATLRDPEGADRLLGAILGVAGLAVDGQPVEGATRLIAGHDVIVADKLLICRTGDKLVVANDADLMQAALDADAPDLAGAWPAMMAAMADVPADAVAWAGIDMHRLREAGQVMPDRLPNPLAGLLFGAWHQSMLEAEQVVAWAQAGAEDLDVTLMVEREADLPASHEGFIARDVRAPVAFELVGQVAQTQVARDWASLFAARESLLTLEGSSQLAEFAAGLTTILGQIDFIEEVLPSIDGPVRLLAVARDFDGLQPTPKLPAFALVTPLRDGADELSRRLYSAGQMGLTLINFGRAEQGQTPLLMDMIEHRGVRMVTGAFAPPPAAPEIVSIEYNFEPAICVVGGHLVVASTPGLARTMIDGTLDAGPGERLAAIDDTLTIDGANLASVLALNREELIANQMLEKGHDRARAELDMDAIINAVEHIDHMRLTSHAAHDGCRAKVRLTLSEPAPDD